MKSLPDYRRHEERVWAALREGHYLGREEWEKLGANPLLPLVMLELELCLCRR